MNPARGHRHPAFQPELRTRAAELYREHQSLAKVAAEMEMSKTRVYGLLVEVGVMPLKKVDHDAA